MNSTDCRRRAWTCRLGLFSSANIDHGNGLCQSSWSDTKLSYNTLLLTGDLVLRKTIVFTPTVGLSSSWAGNSESVTVIEVYLRQGWTTGWVSSGWSGAGRKSVDISESMNWPGIDRLGGWLSLMVISSPEELTGGSESFDIVSTCLVKVHHYIHWSLKTYLCRQLCVCVMGSWRDCWTYIPWEAS